MHVDNQAPSKVVIITNRRDRVNQEDPLLSPAEAAEYTHMTAGALAQLRFRGLGPRFLKPTERTVLYRKSVLDEWLAASERTGTGQVA
jgi:hypothetical protein